MFSAFAKAKLAKVEEAQQAARLGVRIDKDHGVSKLNYVLGILLMQKREYAHGAAPPIVFGKIFSGAILLI